MASNNAEEERTTTRYTNEEWASIISQASADLTISPEPHRCSQIGPATFAKTIDHTLLKLEAKPSQFDDLCSEARVHGFATVCVRPPFVKQCVADLKSSDVRVSSVIGFHEGTYDLYHKLQETKLALHSGASELDVVLNWPQLQAADYASIFNELASLRLQAAHPTILKLILEISQLTNPHIVAACTLAAAASFDFVKTSTGFNGHGATEEHVRLMSACCEKLAGVGKSRMEVKASGGIRTLDDAVRMLEAGATRLGTSAGVWIAKERSVRAPGAASRDGERPGMSTSLFTDY